MSSKTRRVLLFITVPVIAFAIIGGFLSKVSFHDTESDAYRKVLRAIPSISKAIRDKVPFPKTRRLIFMDGKPTSIPGWAVLNLES